MASDSTSDSPVHPEVYPGPAKGLLLLVKVLGVVMVLLFVALIAGIIYKAQKSKTVPIVSDVMDLGVDPATIRQMELDGNTLAITTDSQLLVIDVKQRKVIMRSAKN
jgi:hypothetical protein